MGRGTWDVVRSENESGSESGSGEGQWFSWSVVQSGKVVRVVRKGSYLSS